MSFRPQKKPAMQYIILDKLYGKIEIVFQQSIERQAEDRLKAVRTCQGGCIQLKASLVLELIQW